MVQAAARLAEAVQRLRQLLSEQQAGSSKQISPGEVDRVCRQLSGVATEALVQAEVPLLLAQLARCVLGYGGPGTQTGPTDGPTCQRARCCWSRWT